MEHIKVKNATLIVKLPDQWFKNRDIEEISYFDKFKNITIPIVFVRDDLEMVLIENEITENTNKLGE